MQAAEGLGASGSAATSSGDGHDPQSKAEELVSQAGDKAQQAAGQVQDRLREQVDQRSAQFAEQIGEQASDLRSVAESLRQQGKDGPAQAAERLAQYAERAGAYLQGKDSHALLGDLEDLGRRRPWAAIAGGVAAGFAASRFLKASSRQRYAGRMTVQRPNGVYAGQSTQPQTSPRPSMQQAAPPPVGAVR